MGQVKQMELAEQVELRETQPKSLTPGVGGQPIREPAEGSPLHRLSVAGISEVPQPSVELVSRKCYFLSLFLLEVGKEMSWTKAAWSL